MSSKIRDILLDTIKKDILGPHEKDEIFENSDHPQVRYLCGVLYPVETPVSEDDVMDRTIQISSSENDGDEEKIPINVGRRPSSMGITCNIPAGYRFVSAIVSYARYLEKDKHDAEEQNVKPTEPAKSRLDWHRVGHEPEPIMIDLEKSSDKVELEENIFFRYHTQHKGKYVVLSAYLTNEKETKSGAFVPDDQCVFQSKIRLFSPDSSKIFSDISRSSKAEIDKMTLQDREVEFLYRDHRHFAQGHNCSAEWDVNEADTRTGWIQTTFIPSYEMPGIGFRKPTDDLKGALCIKLLASVANHHDYQTILSPVADAYEKWIVGLEDRLAGTGTTTDPNTASFSDYGNIPKDHVIRCRDALARIRDGISRISDDPLVGEAFRFANTVMHESITHTQWAKSNREKILQGKSIDEDGPGSSLVPEWRLFQLAFLLLTLESIYDPSSKYRNTADLLWFPTGGGKTEAYFGIIAFTLAYRRLKGMNAKTIDEELDRYGVSVIMRYTYRLLTLQQFKRAATLFCACEYVRMGNKKKFGDQPFLVGLWVGATTTPNSFAEAKKIIQKRPTSEKTNPIQIHDCPWCGRKMDHHNYEWTQDVGDPDRLRPRRIQIRCDKRCFFGKPGDPDRVLPVLLVDEDIRNLCPSLLLSTVDKFAQISWNWEYSVLFGNVAQYCKQHGYSPGNAPASSQKLCNHVKFKTNRDGEKKSILVETRRKLAPPELVIQDELHLIAGPLGTLVGLYETAIDILCTNEDTGVKPKIIASTATTKTSGDQLRLLFNSDSAIFPPQGFEFGDSYFAEVLPVNEEHPGKLYVGVCPSSVGMYHVDSRVSSSMLRKVRHIRENKEKFYFGGKTLKFSDDDLDPYYTMVNYYNTIKSLGAAVRMYEDTIPGNMEVITESVEKRFQTQNNMDSRPATMLLKEELTGRISATKIPSILQKVEERMTDGEALDAILCTNMFSVGVDVDRLSVMVVNGQPKSASEYIQATGRIGRKSPGIVVANYSYMRPRDLSHFENFVQFHSTYHKLVEPGTLTPLSGRARDRGLAGVFMALVRLTNRTLSEDPKRFDPSNPDVAVRIRKVRDQIIARAHKVNPREIDGTRADLCGIITKWCHAIERFRNRAPDTINDLRYRRPYYKRDATKSYLLNSSRDPYNEHAFMLPDSLRDAESEIKLYYADRYGDGNYD